MSRWRDSANRLAAYARDTLAAVTLWPLRQGAGPNGLPFHERLAASPNVQPWGV